MILHQMKGLQFPERKVKVQAETIKLIADEKISLGTDRAFIDITDETITLLGKEVIVE